MGMKVEVTKIQLEISVLASGGYACNSSETGILRQCNHIRRRIICGGEFSFSTIQIKKISGSFFKTQSKFCFKESKKRAAFQNSSLPFVKQLIFTQGSFQNGSPIKSVVRTMFFLYTKERFIVLSYTVSYLRQKNLKSGCFMKLYLPYYIVC